SVGAPAGACAGTWVSTAVAGDGSWSNGEGPATRLFSTDELRCGSESSIQSSMRHRNEAACVRARANGASRPEKLVRDAPRRERAGSRGLSSHEETMSADPARAVGK